MQQLIFGGITLLSLRMRSNLLWIWFYFCQKGHCHSLVYRYWQKIKFVLDSHFAFLFVDNNACWNMWLDLYHRFEKGKNKPYIMSLWLGFCFVQLCMYSRARLVFHPYQRQTRVVSICHWNECLMVMSSSALKQMASRLANSQTRMPWHGIDS